MADTVAKMGSMSTKKHIQQWRSVPGYEGAYMVSDDGQVRSLSRRVKHALGGWRTLTERILAQSPDGKGYMTVALHMKGRQKSARVHVLVKDAFHGPRPPGRVEVCHGDGVPGNNVLSNLRYDTHANNVRDRKGHGTDNSGARNGCAKLTVELVREIRQAHARAGARPVDLAKLYGVSESCIRGVTSGRRWAHVVD